MPGVAVTLTAEAVTIFEDARAMHRAALEQLEAGDIRDAAEKAWCTTRRAAEALILALAGEAAANTTQVSSGLRGLRWGREAWARSPDEAARLAALVDRFAAAASSQSTLMLKVIQESGR